MLRSIVIPKGVEVIGDRFFKNCSSLTDVSLPSGLTDIGYEAFYGCSSLTKVAIPSSLTSIKDFTFYGCSSFTDIVFPSSLTSIGYKAFYGCRSLACVSLPDGLREISEEAFCGCCSLLQIAVPDSVKFIGNGAFGNCSLLTDVILPSNLDVLREYVFGNCVSLTHINLPSKITRVDDGAFYGCSSLLEITLPNSVKALYCHVFEGCSSLRKVVVGSGIRTLPYNIYGDVRQFLFGTYFQGSNTVEMLTFADGEDELEGPVDGTVSCLPLKYLYIGRRIKKEYRMNGKQYSNDTFLVSDSLKKHLEVLELGNYVTELPWGIETLESLRRFVSGENITEYTDMSQCSCLSEIYLRSSVPPSALDSYFTSRQYAGVSVYVPIGTIAAYKASPVWANFLNIMEWDSKTTGMSDIKLFPLSNVRYYSPDGILHPGSRHGLNLVRMSDGTVRKVYSK